MDKKTTQTLEMKNKIGKFQHSAKMVSILDKITKACIHLAVFLLPLFFLPVTVSPVEFNKLALLVVLVGISGVAWIGRMVSENQLQMKKSFLSVPILIFATVYIFSSIFSIYRENSIWGYLGGEGMSLTAMLFFVLLFYIIANNFSNKNSVYYLIFNFLISSSLVFLSTFFQLMGVNIFGFMEGSGKAFNTIGTIFSLAIYAGSLLVFSLALITERVGGKLLRIIASITALLALTTIVLIDFKLVWLALVILMGLLMVVGILRNNQGKINLFWIPTAVFIVCLFGLFMKSPFFNMTDLPVEISPSWKATTSVTWNGIKERFLFGSGPGNFAYLYGEYKGAIGNLSAIDFSQGVSFVTTLFATGGLAVGLGFLFLVFIMGRYVGINVYSTFFKKKNSKAEIEEMQLITPLSLLWIFITIMLFFTTASLSLLFVWWMAFAIIDALSHKGNAVKVKSGKSKVAELAEKIGMRGKTGPKEEISKVSLAISLLFVGILTGFIAVVYIMSQKYVAACHYQNALAQATEENANLEQVGNELNKSIYYNPNRDLPFLALSDVYLLLAQKRIGEKGTDINDEDRTYVWEAISGGLQAANSAITVNKSNYRNYLKLALIYQNIIGLVDGAEKPAIENYEKARDLNPNNFYIYDQLAGVYLTFYDIELLKKVEENGGTLDHVPDSVKENLVRAEENLNKSLEIYPLNPTARMTMITIRELQGDLEGAVKLAEENLSSSKEDFRSALVLGLLYYKNTDYQKAVGLLEAVNKRWDNFSDARYILGLSYAQEGELQKAKEQFEKIAEINDDSQEIKDILESLRAGRTDFLENQGNEKVDEVQQQLEADQRQEDQNDQAVLGEENNQEPEGVGEEQPEESQEEDEENEDESQPEENTEENQE